MRLVRLLFSFVLLTVFGALLLLFLGQNWGMTRVDFFGLQYSIHLAWVLAGAAAFGVLTTLALLLPGRLAAMMHTWSLERELRQWEQDLWKLQARHERLLARQEHLLEAHERVLQSHHRLVGEHSQVAAERDQARAELAAARTSLASALSAASTLPAAHQPALQPTTPNMPRVAAVAAVSSVSAISKGASSAPDVESTTSKAPAASRPHTHSAPRVVHSGRAGGRVTLPPASRSTRWAARWPAARSAGQSAPPASASLRAQGAADEQAGHTVSAAAPAPDHPIANELPTHAPVVASTVAGAPNREGPPDMATAPVPPAVEKAVLRSAPPTVPLPAIEPAAAAAAAAVAAPSEMVAPVAPPLAPHISRPAVSSATPAPSTSLSLQNPAGRTGESLAPVLATLRTQLHADMAKMAGALAATRVIQARLAELMRSIFLSELPLDPSVSASTPGDPSGDDEWS